MAQQIEKLASRIVAEGLSVRATEEIICNAQNRQQLRPRNLQ
jgi:hypothetical protein